MASSSSSNSRLLIVGALVLLVGIALVLLVVRNADDQPSASPSPLPTSTATAQPQVDPTELATAVGAGTNPSAVRLDSFDPLVIEDGFEAVAVPLAYGRAVAAIPLPGDLLNLYRMPQPDKVQPPLPVPPVPGQPVPLLPLDAPATLILGEVEVLGMIGPLPAANGGTLTVVLAVRTIDVPLIIQAANSNEIYASLLPRPEETETPTPVPAESTTP